jgi:hypothetical protein
MALPFAYGRKPKQRKAQDFSLFRLKIDDVLSTADINHSQTDGPV